MAKFNSKANNSKEFSLSNSLALKIASLEILQALIRAIELTKNPSLSSEFKYFSSFSFKI